MQKILGLSMKYSLMVFHVAHYCDSIFFIDDPTDHNPSGWKRAFGDSAWFTESLPNRFPTARKYVFACQQQRIPSSSADIVQNAARSLLLQWAQLDIDTSRNTAVRRQSNTVHRPVLFVCQRLGGLVVQKVRWGRRRMIWYSDIP